MAGLSEEAVVVAPSGPDAPDRSAASMGWQARLFGSPEFFRLWLAQVVSATGDWLGLLAITALATQVGGGNAGTSVSLVLAARLVPGFFLATFAGVLVDRVNRKRVMIFCDLGRAAVLASLPFVESVAGLVFASLLLEVFTMLWQPAKEASVPNIVPTEYLTTANSLSLAAAYGTLPIGAGLFALLAKLSGWFGDHGAVDTLRLNQEGLAFYFDSVTFLITAALVLTIPFPHHRREGPATAGRIFDFSSAFRDVKEGWEFIFINPVVRAVMVGLATGLIGGGMLVPLGPIFADEVLGAGDAGFGVFVTCLGMGVAAGVLSLSFLQKKMPKERVFVGSVFLAGATLLVAASVSDLLSAAALVTVIGMAAGAVYVLGFTLLHENVEDEMRGRIFSALLTIVRLCVLVAFAIGPMLSQLLDGLSNELWDRSITVMGVDVAIPGVRLTLWLAGLIIILAGALATMSLRSVRREEGGYEAVP
ncbi:MAG: MFS transporter [Acidimicrobiia bacterium]|nr:MFS transporter [Acidimicrobiia bacterium]